MTGIEWWALVIGGGGLASIISVWLTHKRDKERVEIDWYDRASKEVLRLEERIRAAALETEAAREESESLRAYNRALRQDNKELRASLNELEAYVKDLETLLKDHIEKEEES